MPTAVEVPPDTAGAAGSAGASCAVDAAAPTGAVDPADPAKSTDCAAETTAPTTNTGCCAAAARAPAANSSQTAVSVAAATAAASAAVAASLPNNESTANFEILDIPTEQELLELEGGDTDVLDADDGADGANEEWESPGKRRRVGEHGVGVAAEQPTEKSSSSRKGKRGKKKTKRQEDAKKSDADLFIEEDQRLKDAVANCKCKCKCLKILEDATFRGCVATWKVHHFNKKGKTPQDEVLLSWYSYSQRLPKEQFNANSY